MDQILFELLSFQSYYELNMILGLEQLVLFINFCLVIKRFLCIILLKGKGKGVGSQGEPIVIPSSYAILNDKHTRIVSATHA